MNPPNLEIPPAPDRNAFTRRADTWPTHRTRDQERRRRLRAVARARRLGNLPLGETT